MGAGDDSALGGLAEDLGQPDDRQDAVDQVAQDVTGTDGRELIDIADEDHGGAEGTARKQLVHEGDIDHGTFVDDEEVGFERDCFRGEETAGPGLTSRRRWMVRAGWPVASESRLAARPVGAQRRHSTPLARRMSRRARIRVVLPTPGPPVMTSSRWRGRGGRPPVGRRASGLPSLSWHQARARSTSMGG
jgi:hypothetical protein